jgi:exosortase/archaeosortase family protein
MIMKFSKHFLGDKGAEASKDLRTLLLKAAAFFVIVYAVLPIVTSLLQKSLGMMQYIRLTDTKTEVFGLFVILIFLFFNKHELFKFKFGERSRKEIFLLSMISIALYFLYFVTLVSRDFYTYIASYIFLILEILSVCVLIFGWKFSSSFHKSLFYAGVIVIAFFCLNRFLYAYGGFLSIVISNITHFFLSLVSGNATLSLLRGYPMLGLEKFVVHIGDPCSGIDSISLFVALFIFLAAYDARLIDKKKMVPYFILGIIGVYAMAVLRLILLMFVGAYISPSFAIGLFHENAGLFMFIAYFFLYACYVYPHMLTKPGGKAHTHRLKKHKTNLTDLFGTKLWKRCKHGRRI